MKIRELIERLQNFIAEHPETADAEILPEGADCWSGDVGVSIHEDGCVLLKREAPAPLETFD
jgi:hypothetical protein